MSHPIVHYLLSCRAHPRSGSVQTSPTSTPMSSRRGRQLPQLPPTGKERSKSPGCFLFALQGYCLWVDLKDMSIEWGHLYISAIVCFCSVSYNDIIWWPSWLGLRTSFGFSAVVDSHTFDWQRKRCYLLMESLSIHYRSYHICKDFSLLFYASLLFTFACRP